MEQTSNFRRFSIALLLLLTGFLFNAGAGCQLGGKETVVEHVFVEPGSDAVEVATDKKIPVVSNKIVDGKKVTLHSEENLAGKIVTPKSVFMKLSRAYLLQQQVLKDPELVKIIKERMPEVFAAPTKKVEVED